MEHLFCALGALVHDPCRSSGRSPCRRARSPRPLHALKVPGPRGRRGVAPVGEHAWMTRSPTLRLAIRDGAPPCSSDERTHRRSPARQGAARSAPFMAATSASLRANDPSATASSMRLRSWRAIGARARGRPRSCPSAPQAGGASTGASAAERAGKKPAAVRHRRVSLRDRVAPAPFPAPGPSRRRGPERPTGRSWSRPRSAAKCAGPAGCAAEPARRRSRSAEQLARASAVSSTRRVEILTRAPLLRGREREPNLQRVWPAGRERAQLPIAQMTP